MKKKSLIKLDGKWLSVRPYELSASGSPLTPEKSAIKRTTIRMKPIYPGSLFWVPDLTPSQVREMKRTEALLVKEMDRDLRVHKRDKAWRFKKSDKAWLLEQMKGNL